MKFELLFTEDADQQLLQLESSKDKKANRIFWFYGPGKGQITILDISPHP